MLIRKPLYVSLKYFNICIFSKYPGIRYGRTTTNGDLILSDMSLECLWLVKNPATNDQEVIYFSGEQKPGDSIREGDFYQVAGTHFLKEILKKKLKKI